MSPLPGWDSLDGVSNWHNAFNVAGVIVLGLLVVTETFAQIYGYREATLTRIAESARDAEQKEKENQANKTIAGLRSQAIARRLNPDQRSALVAVLAPFAGQKVSIMCSNTAWDCANFGEDFRSTFKEAKWDVPDGIAVGIPLGSDPVGVELAVNPAWGGNNPPAVLNALAIAMIQLGFVRPPIGIARVASIPPGTIEFRIGRIPPPQ